MVALKRPSDEDYASVKAFFCGYAPIVYEEMYIRHREDIVTLRAAEENTWLDTIIQAILVNCSIRPIKVRIPTR